jgi:ribonucleotide reductase alpha subunit
MNNIYFFSINIGTEWDNYNYYFHIKTLLSLDDLILELHQKAQDYINKNKHQIETSEYEDDNYLFSPYLDYPNFEFPLKSCYDINIGKYLKKIEKVECLEIK